MRNAILCVVGLVLCCFCATFAQAEDGVMGSDLAAAIDSIVAQSAKVDPWTPAVSLTFKGRTNFITPNGYANGAAVQTDLNLAWPCGFYADLWSSVGTNDRKFSSDFRDEADVTLGYTGKLKLFGSPEVSFDSGIAYFDLYRLTKWRGDILDPYLVLSKSFDLGGGNSLTPSVKVENLLSTTDWSSRWQATVGATHAVDLGWHGVSLSNTVKAVYDGGTATADSGLVYSWKVGFDIPLNEKKSVLLGLAYERMWVGNGIRDRESAEGVEIALTLKF